MAKPKMTPHNRQRRQRDKRELERIVRQFNLTHTVGDYVLVRKDCGREVETILEQPAMVLQGHSAVAWFRGISGCYSIEDGRVRAISPTPAA